MNKKRVEIYEVTGRCTHSGKLVGYQLTDSNGDRKVETLERVEILVQKGLISNMRVTVGLNNKIEVRGRNVNLAKLPEVEASSLKPADFKKLTTTDTSYGKTIITKRLLYKGTCFGYEVITPNKKTKHINKEKAIDLATKKMLSNAEVVKYTDDKTGEQYLILKGIDKSLTELPSLYLLADGRLIDTNKESDDIEVRAIFMKSNGVIQDKLNNSLLQFKKGDFIICYGAGDLKVISTKEFEKQYIKSDKPEALCDDYFNNDRYSLEIFGRDAMDLKVNMIKQWMIRIAKK